MEFTFPPSADPTKSKETYDFFYSLVNQTVDQGGQRAVSKLKSLIEDNSNPAEILRILLKILLDKNYPAGKLYNLVFLAWVENPRAKLNYNNSADDFIGLAARNNRIDIVEELLDKGANPNQNDGNSLQWAARNGNSDMVKMLLNKNANPTLDNFNSLKWATTNKHQMVVNQLLMNIMNNYPNEYAYAKHITEHNS